MPAEVGHDLAGFRAILGVASRTTNCFFEEIEIDMSKTIWFDAAMCALFGSLLYKLRDALNNVILADIQPSVRGILSKNGFLSHYGEDRIPDRWGTTIQYHRFETSDDRSFAEYIERELVHRPEMPSMSRHLTKKFRESIFEIFSNAVLHSETKLGVFSCGQFFPNKRTLNFTVADLGIGICESIRKHTGRQMSPCRAIEWATQGNNTTKKDSIPGGLGLKLLGEFIDLNHGSIQIVSDTGYWRRENARTFTETLDDRFDGTVVSLKIDTADEHSYRLSSEPDIADIF